MSSKKADLLLLCVAAIGGSGFIGMKYLLEWGFSTFQIISGRFFVACLFLVVCFFPYIKKIKKEEIKAGFLMGLFLFGVFCFMTIGLHYCTPSVNAFLTNTQAVLVPFLMWIIFKQRPEKHNFLAAVIAVIGIGFISMEGSFSMSLGAFLSLLGSVCYALQMVVTGKFSKQCNPICLTIVEDFTVLIFASLFAVFLEGSLPPITMQAAGVFAGIGFFCTGVCFLLQSIAQKYTTEAKTALLISSESVFAACFSALLYGERMKLQGYIGCFLIFCAIVLAETKFSFFTQNKKEETEI